MIKVAVLGATGMVGQKFIQLLENHPWFEITALMASEKRVGKPYGKEVDWIVSENIPENVREMEMLPMDPKYLDADIVFSALPSDVAREVEPKFAEAGFVVASNASAYRMEEDVPLIIPEVNPDHLGLIEVQKKKRGWDGFIVTNPNCTTIILVLTLKPLMDLGLKEDQSCDNASLKRCRISWCSIVSNHRQHNPVHKGRRGESRNGAFKASWKV